MIALDSNVFIYVLDGNEEFGGRAVQLLDLAQGSGSASMFVYLELLSGLHIDSEAKRQLVQTFLDEQRLRYIEVSKEVMRLAARLRVEQAPKLGVANSLHIASALQAGASRFVTNDRALHDLAIDGLEVSGL